MLLFMYVLYVYFSNSWLALIYNLINIVFDHPLLSDLNMVLQLRTSNESTTFLTSVGIPSAPAETYAIKFTENRLTHLDLPDSDKTILNSLNITVFGDQLTILRLANIPPILLHHNNLIVHQPTTTHRVTKIYLHQHM